jgi:hypothetical protein
MRELLEDEIRVMLCYHSVQNRLPSRLLIKSINIKIYKTATSHVVLHGCKTWSRILGEEYRLRVFENRVLRGIFGPKTDEITGG